MTRKKTITKSNWGPFIQRALTAKKKYRQRQSELKQHRQEQEMQVVSQQEEEERRLELQRQEEERQLELQRQEEERQLELQRQEEEERRLEQEEKLRKKIFDFGRFFSKMLVWEDPHQELKMHKSMESVFLINLNHGLVPLVYNDKENPRHPVKIKEYRSNIKQIKVLKAPIGSCPRSYNMMHLDLIARLKKIKPQTDDIFHHEILNKISSKKLNENYDILHSNRKAQLMESNRLATERLISDHANATYQQIIIEKDELTVNKYFAMDETEKDGDIYFLREALISLPFPSNIQLHKSLDGLPPPTNILYSAGDIHFTSTVPIQIISDTTTTYPPGTSIILKMGMVIIYDRLNINTHLADMGIESIFIDENGNYKLYPYKTGIQVENGMVRYEAFTGIQSCPYFIEYVKKMILLNKKTVGSLSRVSEDIVSICTSLLYPFEHETVFAINSLILTNYFRNISCLYTYDFTCQALTLLEVPHDSRYDLTQLDEILHDHPGTQQLLYTYAKGITKRNKSKKKQKRTRKNNK